MVEVIEFSKEEIEKLDVLQLKMRDFFKKSEKTLYEREELVRLIVLSILAKEHMFMYGPPGSAKSVVATALQILTNDRPFFRYLMTDFTQYDAIFGKESVLTEGALPVRILDKKLPTAFYAFLDEIFKANAEILNALLTILNERLFDDDYNGTIEVPICTVLAASNEFPRTSYLKALFERFIFRIPVPNIKEFDNRLSILNGEVVPLSDLEIKTIDESEINFVQKNYKKIKLSAEQGQLIDNVINTLHDLMNPDNNEGKVETLYEISGRTIYKIGAIMRLSAYVNKRTSTNVSDFLLLRYMVWSNMQERGRVLPKINQILFGGESEFHGDITKELEFISIPTLRYLNGIRPTVLGANIQHTEKDFNDFHFALKEFKKLYNQRIDGLNSIKEKLHECLRKEKLVEENIFLHADKVLDWRVGGSLIKVNSEKFNELSRLHFVSEMFGKLEINSNDGIKYPMMQLINDVLYMHKALVEEMNNWLMDNDTFFSYKIKNKENM